MDWHGLWWNFLVAVWVTLSIVFIVRYLINFIPIVFLRNFSNIHPIGCSWGGSSN
jgi:hypothetical protein